MHLVIWYRTAETINIIIFFKKTFKTNEDRRQTKTGENVIGKTSHAPSAPSGLYLAVRYFCS